MLVSSTLAQAGRVVTLPKPEAERLVAAGYAEPFQEPDFEGRLSVLENRIGKLESAMTKPQENAAKEPAKPRKGK